MIALIENQVVEDYEAYRFMMLEEADLILKDRKKYIKTNSMSPSVKIFNLDHIVDFFYLEEELLIVEELSNIRRAIIIRHFLRRMFSDI